MTEDASVKQLVLEVEGLRVFQFWDLKKMFLKF